MHQLISPVNRQTKLSKSMWKVSDLAGSKVLDASGVELGVLSDVLPSGSNDIWVVQAAGGKEILISAGTG